MQLMSCKKVIMARHSAPRELQSAPYLPRFGARIADTQTTTHAQESSGRSHFTLMRSATFQAYRHPHHTSQPHRYVRSTLTQSPRQYDLRATCPSGSAAHAPAAAL